MAGTTRYLRFIILAIFVLVVIFFFSSSTSTTTVKSTTDILKQQTGLWKGVSDKFGRPPTPGTGPAGANPPEGTVPGGSVPGSTVPGVAAVVPGQEEDDDSTGKTSADTETNEKSAFEESGSTGSGKPILSNTNSNVQDSSPAKSSTPSTSSSKDAGEYQRANATFVTLARNGDVWEISRSIRQVEDRFNHNYNYDWVFLNDDDFDDRFKNITTTLTSGRARYGKIASEHWGFPSFIDQEKAARVREDFGQRGIIYGDSISYRHMCRYESGFFFRHPLMMEYEYYWRVEPSIELYCDVAYDPFKFMKENGKKYSFVLSLKEYIETIPTLWDSVKSFMQKHPEHISADNSMGFISDDNGETYNNCHFWSNFEIGHLDWLRSDAYIKYFESLDQDGGFFYERWGDAPVHSIAAALMLKKEEIHFFNDIAYYHVPFTHCPNDLKTLVDLRCHCDPGQNFDWNGYSCTSKYFEVNKKEKPPGHDPTK